MKAQYLAAIALLFLAGCGNRANTASPDAYTKSMQAMVADMPADKRNDLRDALVAITFDTVDPTVGVWSNADPTAPIFMGAGDKINGKSADAIIKLGYQTRIRLLDQAIAEDGAAIARVKAERQKYAATLDNIHVDSARYHVENDMFMKNPIVSFKITNNSAKAIKRIYLAGVLTSPGRSIPWVSSDINYEFSGGLEPGESQALDLQPNMFGDWKIDDRYSNRTDLNLSLTVTNIEDASGQQLLQGDPGDAASKAADAAAKQKLRTDLAAKLSKM